MAVDGDVRVARWESSWCLTGSCVSSFRVKLGPLAGCDKLIKRH
jgi:hypothetical protein